MRNPFQRLSSFFTFFAGGYDGGDTNRMRNDLGFGRVAARDEDTVVGDATRNLLRQKAADLRRNDPVVAGACERIALFTVGHKGILPQAKTSDSGWNRAAEQWWNTVYSPMCDSRGRNNLAEFQAMAVGLRPTHGGMYFQRIQDGTIRPIETERIRQPQDAEKAKAYTEGVKVDPKTGRILAYSVHARCSDGTFAGKHDEIDVPSENMLSVVKPAWRPDMIREIPDLAPIIPALVDIHELNKYTLNTAKFQSMVLGFIKKNGGLGLNSQQRGSSTRTVGERTSFKFDWGEVFEGRPGDDFEMKSSITPNANHIPYVKLQLALCASALGFPYEFFTLDLSGLDYSRQKGMLLLVNNACRPWKQWLADRFLQPLWSWRVAMAMRPGGPLSPAPKVDGESEWARVEWQFPEEPWIDRQEAQQADVLEVQAGLSTLGRASKRRGYDLEDTLREKAREQKLIQTIATEENVAPESLVKMQIPGQTDAPKETGNAK